MYTIYYVKGTIWTKKGSFTNDVSISGNKLRLVSEYKDQNGKWYRKRTSLANVTTLAPISYKLEGTKSNLELNFGNNITGRYYDLGTKKEVPVTLQAKDKYVDYSIADHLITTLPLKTGYKATFPEFYYDSKTEKLITNYIIKEVKSYVYRSPKTGDHESWLVNVLEESTGALYYYVVDKAQHRLWQREMSVAGGTWEICVDEELDYQPIKNKFNKEEALAKLEKGTSVIIGTSYARDHARGGIALLNLNKAQFAPKGTIVTIIPNSPYIEEWKEVNKKIRKGKKLIEVPIDPNVQACIKTTKVYDDKGHFEFTNLMPGEYLLSTSFGYTHNYAYSYQSGTSYLMHPSGAVLSSNAVYSTASGSTGVKADIETAVTIKENGEQVKVNLKDVR
ncbi:hypothetical protein GCM10011425_19500 [Mucilaginibacter galii]|uniref:Carboxypeptidase regulatory-like domain-containing protein n=1 Tax=Mucilaginibacter galii TaxID=2005073 RepID=A0A917J802_9SPHI|nr:hypothetical protein GCM10011425_19500 [Mucilaginibacter galii]